MRSFWTFNNMRIARWNIGDKWIKTKVYNQILITDTNECNRIEKTFVNKRIVHAKTFFDKKRICLFVNIESNVKEETENQKANLDFPCIFVFSQSGSIFCIRFVVCILLIKYELNKKRNRNISIMKIRTEFRRKFKTKVKQNIFYFL